MNRKIFTMIAVVLLIAIPVMAVNVSINTSTDRLVNSVGGSFGSGTLNYLLDATTGTHMATTTMNVVNSSILIGTNGLDTTTWHPGVVGQTNSFQAVGGFTATYQTSTNGNYGILGTYVNAASVADGAGFAMSDTQYFNIMSGNHTYNVVGNFAAYAGGNDNQVAMNLKSIGSMYVYSEATNGGVGLRGNTIWKEISSTKNDVSMTNLFMGVQTTGIASISNSNIWGFGNNETGTLSTTNYGGGTRTVTATGSGTYQQSGFGANTLNFNGFNLPGGGSANLSAGFSGGFSGTYTMDAK